MGIYDQLGLFAAGLIYGPVLALAKDGGQGYLFWLVACGMSALFTFCYLLVWRCIVIPHDRKKKREDDNAQLAASQRVFGFDEEVPTDADYFAYGRFVVDLLHKRKWYWRTKQWYVKRM